MNLVVTLIANPQTRNLTDSLVAEIADILKPHNVVWLATNKACDLYLATSTLDGEAEAELAEILTAHKIDYAVQISERRKKYALIADMDSTVIHQECVDELALEAGVGEHVAEITARAMNGEIDFVEAMEDRVALLEGLGIEAIARIIENRLTFVAGGRELVQTMNANGCYTALVSGGFTAFTEYVSKNLGFHEHRANILEIVDNALTGEIRKPILGGEAKVTAMHEISNRLKLTNEDFITVGDGANDIPMLKLAGTGVALHAKPKVQEEARIKINHGDLTSLLYLQGYRESEFQK